MIPGERIGQRLIREFKSGTILTQLIWVNIALFILINLAYVLVNFGASREFFMGSYLNQFRLSASLEGVLYRPWTLITHMFSHRGFLHILFNMLWLYWIGRILQDFIGERKIVPLYIYGGLGGALFFILAYQLIPSPSFDASVATAWGASAAVMAIVVGTATLVPNHTLFLFLIGPVKLKWLALAFVALDFIGLGGGNAGGSIGHLGGAFAGFLFIRGIQGGYDASRGMNSLIDSILNFFKKDDQPKVVYRSNNSKKKTTPPSQKATGDHVTQEKLDMILDKIAEGGYDKLNSEEKAFLFKYSKKD